VHLPEEEESHLAETDDEVAATVKDESPKKKEEESPAVQASLFVQPKQQSQQKEGNHKKQKVVQAKLFGDSPNPQIEENQKEKRDSKKVTPLKKDKPTDSANNKTFGVGETIELEL
jgi:hypothetical protein